MLTDRLERLLPAGLRVLLTPVHVRSATSTSSVRQDIVEPVRTSARDQGVMASVWHGGGHGYCSDERHLGRGHPSCRHRVRAHPVGSRATAGISCARQQSPLAAATVGTRTRRASWSRGKSCRIRWRSASTWFSRPLLQPSPETSASSIGSASITRHDVDTIARHHWRWVESSNQYRNVLPGLQSRCANDSKATPRSERSEGSRWPNREASRSSGQDWVSAEASEHSCPTMHSNC